MDNLTHSLVGLTAAKAGLEKVSPGATTLCVLAANSPDIDVIVLILKGRWSFLEHHRGITHSIVGSAVLALLLPLIFYIVDRIIARIQKRGPQVRLKGLIVVSFLVTATHPLLDWTNNYGTRFLLPWSPRWFYGDFTFVIDPFFWMTLGAASFLLTVKTRVRIIIWLAIALVTSFLVLSGAVGSGIVLTSIPLRLLWIVVLIVSVNLYRTGLGQRMGSKIAIAALVVVTIYGVALFATHALALQEAQLEATRIADSNAEHVQTLAAMATAADPTIWVCVMETERATYRFNLSLTHDQSGPANFVRYAKPSGSTAQEVAQAELDQRAKIFLGFARFPVMRVVGEDCAMQTLVQFADLRYTEPGRGRGTFSLDVPVDCPLYGRAQ